MLTPFQGAAFSYVTFGWSPIPIVAKDKAPTMVGVTGWKAPKITEADVRKWIQNDFRAPTQTKFKFKPSNIGLHLDEGFIGLDVDAYDGHDGAATFAKATAAWGELPPTWTAHSSRGDGSGIRLFRVRKGLRWPNNFDKLHGKGLDVVHSGHRYVMVWPSIHPEGRPYMWTKPSGKQAEPGDVPATSDIPKLPKSWVQGITAGEQRGAISATSVIGYEDAVEWVDELGRDPNMCRTMKTTLKTWQQRVMAAGKGGFHDAARDGVWSILRDARDGHHGVVGALNKLKKTFGVGVGADRSKDRTRLSQGEWERMICGGVPRLQAEDEPTDIEDPCLALDSGLVVSKTSGVSDLELTELGNAARLEEIANGRLLYQADQESWVVWDEETGLWREDKLQPERWAVKALQELMGTVEKDEGLTPVQKAAVKAFWRAAQKPAGLRSTLDLYKARPRCSIVSSAFDSNASVLACANGLISLGDSGPTFRRLLTREDHVTMSTGVDYVEDAQSPLWDRFINHAQPDEDVRAWIQRLVGYSLLGHNQARRIVMCLGETTTGKGTFVDAISAALGAYAGPSNLTIFRDNQDERPRADLASVLPKRIIFCDEASHAWKLHTDQIKRLTGGSVISARRPHDKAPVEMRPAFTPWLMTNNVPHIEGADIATRRRLLVVPFSQTIKADAEDVTLAHRLTVETEARQAVLAWAVQGYADLMSMGFLAGLATPAGAFAVTEEFTSSMSNLDAFIAECCLRGPEYMTRTQPLTECWENWQQDNVPLREHMKARQFALALNANDMKLSLKRVSDEVVKMRVGIQLNAAYAAQYS